MNGSVGPGFDISLGGPTAHRRELTPVVTPATEHNPPDRPARDVMTELAETGGRSSTSSCRSAVHVRLDPPRPDERDPRVCFRRSRVLPRSSSRRPSPPLTRCPLSDSAPTPPPGRGRSLLPRLVATAAALFFPLAGRPARAQQPPAELSAAIRPRRSKCSPRRRRSRSGVGDRPLDHAPHRLTEVGHEPHQLQRALVLRPHVPP